MERQPSTGGFALLFKINQVTKVEDEVGSIGFRVRQNGVQMQARRATNPPPVQSCYSMSGVMGK